MTVILDRTVTANFTEAISREWLETNGIGGWAGSTITNAHSRHYHGLLVAATRPPVGRVSEIFDGDAPHTPRGCMAQAWSVAEILRAYIEDFQDQR